jgi:hypothetical protein
MLACSIAKRAVPVAINVAELGGPRAAERDDRCASRLVLGEYLGDDPADISYERQVGIIGHVIDRDDDRHLLPVTVKEEQPQALPLPVFGVDELPDAAEYLLV